MENFPEKILRLLKYVNILCSATAFKNLVKDIESLTGDQMDKFFTEEEKYQFDITYNEILLQTRK
jgi:hypothetical protein